MNYYAFTEKLIEVKVIFPQELNAVGLKGSLVLIKANLT